MKILIVGQNPAHKGNIGRPFHETASGHRLTDWLLKLGILGLDFELINASDKLGRIFIADLKTDLPWRDYDKVIALGGKAVLALRKSGARSENFFCLPHPSGLNRKLNDKQALDKLLAACYEYIHGQS